MMNELIKTFTRDDGTIAVDGRDLHDFLEVGKDFTTWFKDMVEYGFERGKDFTPFSVKSTGGRPRAGYVMTLDMAKELSMIQRTERGKQARQYFIEMEKQAKQPKLPVTPAEKIKLLLQNSDDANRRLDQVEQQVIDLRNHQPLNPGEYSYIGREVNHAVNRWVTVQHLKLNTKQRSLLFKDINNGVRQVTGVSTRSQLREKDFKTAQTYIHDWVPSVATMKQIQMYDAEPAGQLEMEM